MGQQTEGTNSFSGGLVKDLNAITTPNTVLTDCINGTLLTMNGNELVLQNDMGNTYLTDPITSQRIKLTTGFVPIGVNEHGGVMYIVSQNPLTQETEIGSFPAPTYPAIDIKPKSIIDFSVVDSIDNGITLDTEIVNPKLGVVIPLTDQIIETGDPFLISITLSEEEIASLSVGEERNQYIPKLISINSKENIDITEDVYGKIQAFTSDGINFSNETNKFWFLTKPLTTNGTFQTYLNAGKVFYYQNRPPGKLGLRFDLESIDKFNIWPDQYGNNLPFVKEFRTGAGIELDPYIYTYQLLFDAFTVIDPSDLKIDTITIDWTIVNNDGSTRIPTGLVIANTGSVSYEITVGTEGRIVRNVLGTIVSFFILELGNNKNQTINYTITPSMASKGVIFTNYKLTETLDLSKTSLEWGLNPRYKILSGKSYLQKINPYNSSGTELIPLATGVKDIERKYGPMNADYNDYYYTHESNKLINLGWLTKDPTILFDINVNLDSEIHVASGNNIEAFALSQDILVNTANIYPILKAKNDFGDISNVETYNTPYTASRSQTAIQLKLNFAFLFDNTGGNSVNNWFDGLMDINIFSANLNNTTGYSISPILEKVSNLNSPLSKNDDIVITNTKTDLVVNGNFSSGVLTPWLTVGPDISIQNMTSSFKQYYINFNNTSIGYKIHQSTTCVSTKYYKLSFYVKAVGTIILEGGFEGGYSGTPSKYAGYSNWTLLTFYITPNTDSSNIYIKISNGGGYGTQISIANIELREKWVQTIGTILDVEPVQAVVTYKEDITLSTTNAGVPIKINSGVYLPSSNYEMVDNFTLNSDLTTNYNKSSTLNYNLDTYIIRT